MKIKIRTFWDFQIKITGNQNEKLGEKSMNEWIWEIKMVGKFNEWMNRRNNNGWKIQRKNGWEI